MNTELVGTRGKGEKKSNTQRDKKKRSSATEGGILFEGRRGRPQLVNKTERQWSITHTVIVVSEPHLSEIIVKP